MSVFCVKRWQSTGRVRLTHLKTSRRWQKTCNAHKEKKNTSLCACAYRDSALQHARSTHLNSHTHRVCRWAKGVGEGLGGWYKASSEYTEQPRLSHFNMADAASWVRLMHAGVLGSQMIQEFHSSALVKYTQGNPYRAWV